MALRSRSLVVSSLAIAATAAFAGCAVPNEDTPASEFPLEERFSRAVVGHVYSDADLVDGVLVRMDESPLSGADRDAVFGTPAYTTNASGFFQFENAPFLYDLSLRLERRLVVFRNLSYRYFDPQIGDGVVAAAFAASVSPIIDPPPGPDMDVAFFASGADVSTLSRDGSGAVVLGSRSFESNVTLHVVTFPKGKGIASAASYGRTDVQIRAGRVVGANVHVDPITSSGTTTITAVVPKGLRLDSIEVGVDFGVRTISSPVTTVVSGGSFSLPLVPFARWFAEAHASSAEGTSDSGRFFFDPASVQGTRITLAALPSPGDVARAENDDGVSDAAAAVGANDAAPWLVTGDGAGIREHVFEPVAHDGPALLVFTTSREAALPDPTLFGLSTLDGTYTWTMRHFPLAPEFKYVQGADGFAFQPSATSAPRTVTLR